MKYTIIYQTDRNTSGNITVECPSMRAALARAANAIEKGTTSVHVKQQGGKQ